MSDKILLIEDEPQIAGFISRGLGREGYDVISATDGETGLFVEADNSPALVEALARVVWNLDLQERFTVAGWSRMRKTVRTCWCPP